MERVLLKPANSLLQPAKKVRKVPLLLQDLGIDCIYQSIVEKLHIELNSITILFHLCRLIRYCDYYFNGWQKVKFGWDEMSWYWLRIKSLKKYQWVKLLPTWADVLSYVDSVQTLHPWCSDCILLCCIIYGTSLLGKACIHQWQGWKASPCQLFSIW